MDGAEDALVRTGAANGLERMGEPGSRPAPGREAPGRTGIVEGTGTALPLFRRLTQGRLRALERESGRVTVSLRERSGGGAGPGARELDRAFRRDARRYDGGLTLL